MNAVSPDSPAYVPPQGLFTRLRRVLPYFGHAKGTWALLVFCIMVVAACEPVLPALMKPLLDHGFTQNSFNPWLVPIAVIVLFSVRGIAGYIADLALVRITSDGVFHLRRDLFNHMLDARLTLFNQKSASALTNTVVYEVTSGTRQLISTLMSASRNVLTLVALLSYLFYVNWQLTLVVGLLFPGMAWIVRYISRRLYRLTRASLGATEDLAYVVEENVLAHRDVRLHGARAVQQRRFEKLGRALLRLQLKSRATSAALTPLTQLLAAISLSLVITVALIQGSRGEATVGDFVSFITAMLMLLSPMKSLSGVANPLTAGLAALERAIQLIETTPLETGGNHKQARSQGTLEFEQVSVTYPNATSPAIDGLNLTVAPGETVALVGASGSGKTTLVNLLPRFIELNSGRILLDGVDLRDWDLASLRAQFAFVSQHVVLLNDSIAANIALGDAEPDEARVRESLQAANLSTFIDGLPEGIHTVVGHNAMQLSGGQRQRLAIARAIYKNAPILILDEATSALDTESERAVQEALERLMRDRTTLVIAHRLSTVQHADRIIVMSAGRIVETGRHVDLIERDGQYARLYKLGLHDAVADLPPADSAPGAQVQA
jgi:subfamily B ATP-binding cassette protein MsbA